MKKFLLFLFTISSLLFSAQEKSIDNSFLFYENKGQIVDQNGELNSAVKYLYNSAGLNVQLRADGFSYDVYEQQKVQSDFVTKNKERAELNPVKRERKPSVYEFHRIDISFPESNKNAEIIASEKSTDYDNYYNVPAKPEGIEKVYSYKYVTYKDIYPNIDVVFFKPDDSLKAFEYNFIVRPGGKISDIRMKFDGATNTLDKGSIVLKTRFGEMIESIPSSWEVEKTGNKNITVNFQEVGNGIYSFASNQDTSENTVIIDPVPTRIWGSYLGGNGDEFTYAKTDASNNLYLYGETSSANNIATSGTFQPTLRRFVDGFINKISKDGKRFWGTYYGNVYLDYIGSISTDSAGDIYCGAHVELLDPAYPTNSYYFFTRIGLLKLNSSGTKIYEKLVGSNVVSAPHIDNTLYIFDTFYHNDKVYIAGETYLKDGFTTAGAFQETIYGGPFSGILGGFDADTGNTNFVTYVGGNHSTRLTKIFAADNDGIEIAGITRATDFPVLNGFQSAPTSGETENKGLYLKFGESGSLIRSSYFGAANSWYVFDGARRFGDEVHFSSITGTQLEVVRVNTSTNQVISMKRTDVPSNFQGITYIDQHKNIFVTGYVLDKTTPMNTVTTPNSYMPTIPHYNASHFLKFNENLEKEWGTFYTGNGGTQISMVIRDNEDYLYFFGLSFGNTRGISTPGVFQQNPFPGTGDTYVAKFADCASDVTVRYDPVCHNQDLKLYANGGTSYEWFGPNGFHSFSQNPIIPNAQAIHSGEYFVKISGGQSCGGTFALNILVGSPAPPIPDLTNLPAVNGNCKTILSAPTATDGCGNKITATTTSPTSDLLPGSYTVVWNFDDGNGYTFSQTQQINIVATALPTTSNSIQSFCINQNATISDLQITGTNIKWYDSAGVVLSSSTQLINGSSYFASQTLSGCESGKVKIDVTINTTAKPTETAAQDFCAAATPIISDLHLSGSSLKFYSSSGALIPASTLLTDGMTYYVTQTIDNCESEKLPVTVSVKNGGIPGNDYSESFCNDTTDNFKTVNLHFYESKIVPANTSTYLFEFVGVTNPGSHQLSVGTNVISVKVSNALGCFDLFDLTINLLEKPTVTLPQNLELCSGNTLTLDAGIGFKNYLWNTGETTRIITVSQPGIYSVEVENNSGCKNSAQTTITQPELGEISSVSIINNTATVNMSVSGDFLYSLDMQTWQTTNIFSNLNNGTYTVYVKTTGNCFVDSEKFTIFSIDNVFSPNGDGLNDTWIVEGIENYPGSEIVVYDRYGNVVLQKITTEETFEWSGNSNSRILPTGTYWYVIKITDGRILNGWLTLKNRN